MPNKAIFYHRGYFNSRPREGGDHRREAVFLWRTISIHAPAKGATCFSVNFSILVIFQFTPPRRGRRALRVGVSTDKTDFNSRPREGGDQFQLHSHGGEDDFNSRPREGGDVSVLASVTTGRHFNSRPREGGD